MEFGFFFVVLNTIRLCSVEKIRIRRTLMANWAAAHRCRGVRLYVFWSIFLLRFGSIKNFSMFFTLSMGFLLIYKINWKIFAIALCNSQSSNLFVSFCMFGMPFTWLSLVVLNISVTSTLLPYLNNNYNDIDFQRHINNSQALSSDLKQIDKITCSLLRAPNARILGWCSEISISLNWNQLPRIFPIQ